MIKFSEFLVLYSFNEISTLVAPLSLDCWSVSPVPSQSDVEDEYVYVNNSLKILALSLRIPLLPT